MTKPKYFIGAMGHLYHTSGRPYYLSPKVTDATVQAVLAARRNGQNTTAPILRLRSDDVGKGTEQETQIGSPRQSRGEFTAAAPEVADAFDSVSGDTSSIHQPMTFPDGPWIRHPSEINEDLIISSVKESMRDDITIEENRERHKERLNKLSSQPNAAKIKEVICVISDPPAVDMTNKDGLDEELLDLMVERWYVNAPLYLEPGMALPPSIRDRYHHDWSWNARGVYYRHYYSPEWVTGDHTLWVPVLDRVDWDDQSEESRRMRAKTFLKHNLDNARWRKSEYAWEADAWNDVFGRMRDDPATAA
jgi:hypothetical protein